MLDVTNTWPMPSWRLSAVQTCVRPESGYIAPQPSFSVVQAIALSGWIWGGRSTSRLSVLPPLPGR